MLDLQAFPNDVFCLIVEQLVATVGFFKAIRLRFVSRAFNSAVLHAICAKQILDINDPATPDIPSYISPALKGRILLVKSRSDEANTDGILCVIARVNKALDDLTESTREQRDERHLMIAEAVAHMSPEFSVDKIDPKIDAQNTLSGAIVIGNLPLVKSLLQTQSPGLVDVNTSSPYFGRPLQIAAAWGHLDIVRHLLGCGADPHQTDDDDENVEWPWKLEATAYINRPRMYHGPFGCALRAAITSGCEDVIQLLLQPEYRPALTKREYIRTIVEGAFCGQTHVIQVLLQGTGKRLTDFYWLGEELLWVAAHYNHPDVVQMVLDNGICVDVLPNPQLQGFGSAIGRAASRGNANMVRFLLERGANPHVSSSEGLHQEAIELASRRGHEEVVELLLAHGASAVKAFYHAADGGQARLLRWLLERDPELYKKEFKKGETVGVVALQKGVIIKNPDVINLMVEIGVPLNHGYQHFADMPWVLAGLYAAEWIEGLLCSLGVDDFDYDNQNRDGCYYEEEYEDQEMRGWVYIVERTWEWVSKY